MYGITRIDHARSHTHSWQVRIQRRHRVVTQHFSDGRYGGRRKALEAATAFRDTIVATHASFTRQAVCSIKKTNNRSGISGVTRIEYYEVNRGRKLLRLYWLAQWPTQAGRATTRKFSVRVYGERGAFVRAREARRKALAAFKGRSWIRGYSRRRSTRT